MKMLRNGAIVASLGGALLAAAVVLIADGTRFSDFTPLTASAGPTANEAEPITLSNASFQQRSVDERNAQLAAGMPNTGAWDMIAGNETGPHKGRYLFTVFESGQAGIQRHDLLNDVTDTIWISPTSGAYIRFDPAYWTPWGSIITGQEEWCSTP